MGTIIPSKLVQERITVEFDFLDELEWGDTLSLAETTVTVLSGIDPNPEVMVILQPVITGNSVLQQVRLGLPGVIYSISITCTTSTGKLIKKSVKVAVLPSTAITPLPFGTYYTSSVYPIDVTDGIDSLQNVPIIGQIWGTLPEGVDSTFSVISGVLNLQVHPYIGLPEGIDQGDISVIAGTLTTILVSYNNYPFEGINQSGVILVTGTLVTIVISYNNYPFEGINSTFSVVSGTLT